MTLGEQIADARKRKGLTQDALAERLGVTRQAVAKWETGKAQPSTANLFALAECLDLPLTAAKPDEAPAGEAPAAPPRWVWPLLFAAVTAALTVLACEIGAAAWLLAAGLLLVDAAALVFALVARRSDRSTAAILRTALGLGGGILAAGLLSAVLWAGIFTVRAGYRWQAAWNIPEEALREAPALSNWISSCAALGPDVYTLRVELENRSGAYVLVYRCGVADGAAGTVTPDPLHYRYRVHYGSGTGDALDLFYLTCSESFSDGSPGALAFTVAKQDYGFAVRDALPTGDEHGLLLYEALQQLLPVEGLG